MAFNTKSYRYYVNQYHSYQSYWLELQVYLIKLWVNFGKNPHPIRIVIVNNENWKIRYSKTKKVCVCHNTTVLSKKDVLLMRDTCKNNAKTMMLILKLMYGWTWFFKISESENSTQKIFPSLYLFLFKYLSRFWLWW